MVSAMSLAGAAHLDGQHSFGDQFSGSRRRRFPRPARARSADRKAVWSCLRFGRWSWRVRRPPGKLGDFDFAIIFLRLGFGQAAPGDLRVGEDDSGNRVGFEGDFVSGDGFDGGASFVRGFVRQHGFADYVANSVDGGIVGLQLLVYLDESALADFDLSFFEAGNFGVGLASDGNENLVEELFRVPLLRGRQR